MKSGGLAAVLREPKGPPGVVVERLPPVAPGQGEVKVSVRAAALNHLDLWVASGAQRVPPPRVLAADCSGVVVESLSPAVAPGMEVVLYPVVSCWECEACRRGEQIRCPEFGILGEHVDGCACTEIVVPAQMIYPKPAHLDFAAAAAFPLTYLTAWRLLSTLAGVRPLDRVLVVGVGGGLGAAALLLARHLGARVAATSRRAEVRQRALALGAEAAFDSAAFAEAAKRWSSGGVDLVIDHVGPATLDESLRSLRRGGKLAIPGSTSGIKAEVNLPRLFWNQAQILGSSMGNAGEFQDMLEAVASGLQPQVDSVFPLDQVRRAMERLQAGEQTGKVVLTMPEGGR